MKKTWWKEGIAYQIYPRSFNDTTGNGMGDLWGVINKLDYIKSLGATIIWLCPVYESPNDDNGYDISDYRKILGDFGGEEAFDKLLEGIREKGFKLVMDLVANHSSDEHYWFTESRKSKANPYRDYYIWKPNDGKPPTNWQSFFGGSTWELDSATNEYYLHLFTKKQPHLNWENPKVRQEIYNIVSYWANKGVDGFRMDVISLISKQQDYPDATTSNMVDVITNTYANRPRIHEYLHEMNREVLSKYDLMTVGEGPGINLDNGYLYVQEEREELCMIFHFDHMFIDCGDKGKYYPIPFDLIDFKKVFSQWDEKLSRHNGWGSIFLGNHDFYRMVSRFGNDGEYRVESPKLLAALLLTLRGTVYIYQGDEIGMTNVAYPSIDDYDDVETRNAWKDAEENGEDMEAFLKVVHRQSRDNARTPMQWDGSTNGGFTNASPWIKVNDNFKSINVESQERDPNSILNFYREIISFRRENPVFVYGEYEPLDELNPNIYAYRRWDDDNEFLMIHNFSDQNIQWDFNFGAEAYELIKTNINAERPLKEFLPWQTKILKRS